MESEPGQQLLDRSGRSVRLTEVGTAVLPFARAALDAVANARLAVDELAGLIRGQVTVGMVSGCALPILAELLASFHQAYPGVSIALTEQNSDRLIELLKGGQLDLALIGAAGDATAAVETAVIVEEELVVLVDPSHPFAAAATSSAGISDPGTPSAVTSDPNTANTANTANAANAPVANPAPQILHITSPQLRSRLELAWTSALPANPAARVTVDHAQRFLRQLIPPAPSSPPAPAS